MSCEGKLDLRCTGKNFAPCIKYESELPEFSELSEGCTNLDETTTEIYNKVQELVDLLDLSTLTSTCVTLPVNKTLLNVLQTMGNYICQQNQTILDMQADIQTIQTQIEDLQQNNCP